MGKKIFWLSIVIANAVAIIVYFNFKTFTFKPFWVSMLHIAVFLIALFILIKSLSKKHI
jgi:hypothetical protein